MMHHLRFMMRIRPAGLDRDAAQWAVNEIGRLRLENKLLFDNIKGSAEDLARFNAALERALVKSVESTTDAENV